MDSLKAKGFPVGLARLRAFRPFPHEEIRALAGKVAGIAVLDRSYTFGAAGAMFTEVKASAYSGQKKPVIKDYIAGLGGRDITPGDFKEMYRSASAAEKPEDEIGWIGVKL